MSLSLHISSLLICDLCFWFSVVCCRLHPIMCSQSVTSFLWQPDPAREEPRASNLPSLNYRQITFPILPWLPGLIFQLGGQKREEMTWGGSPQEGWRQEGEQRVVVGECKETNEFNYPCKHTEDQGYFHLSLLMWSHRGSWFIISTRCLIMHARTLYSLKGVFWLEPDLSPTEGGDCSPGGRRSEGARSNGNTQHTYSGLSLWMALEFCEKTVKSSCPSGSSTMFLNYTFSATILRHCFLFITLTCALFASPPY